MINEWMSLIEEPSKGVYAVRMLRVMLCMVSCVVGGVCVLCAVCVVCVACDFCCIALVGSRVVSWYLRHAIGVGSARSCTGQ